MNKVILVSRLLLGLIFFVFGLNKFLGFMQPPAPSPQGAEFLGALFQAGYFFPFLGVVEVLCGAALLTGLFVPLALLVLAPVVLNIVLYHLFLDPSGIALGLIALVLGLVVAHGYREKFLPLLRVK